MNKITSKDIIAGMQLALEQSTGIGWVNALSNYFPSSQAMETYPWLGAPPAMREWKGPRKAHQLRESFIEIRNKKFESTILVDIDDMRRDSFGMLQARIAEHVQRGETHWAKLLSDLILTLDSTVADDGEYYFDTDHSWGDSGTQSNKITADISALPVSVAGTTIAPSPEEAIQAVYKGIETIGSFVDDQGEPMNEEANEFLVIAPLGIGRAMKSALMAPAGTAITEQKMTDVRIEVKTSPRFASWADKFAVFRTDAPVKPLIRQEEEGVVISAKAEGSDFEHDNDQHEYGLKANRNVGPGRWEYACQVQLT